MDFWGALRGLLRQPCGKHCHENWTNIRRRLQRSALRRSEGTFNSIGPRRLRLHAITPIWQKVPVTSSRLSCEPENQSR